MENAAVICEFDPLHRGHEYLLGYLRAQGAKNIVCILSGAICQRGEPSTFPKHARAEAALRAGADLVLELPFPYSGASAEYFAYGAMSVIGALGCIDTLGFGCECGDAHQLVRAADRMLSREFELEYERVRTDKKSMGAAACIETAYKSLWGDAPLFSGANNVLALEYIKQAKRMGLPLSFCAVKRRGSMHSEMDENDSFASASLIRDKLRSGDRNIEKYIPESCLDIIKNVLDSGELSFGIESAERAVLSHFRLLGADGEASAEMKGGLVNRMISAAENCTDYHSFTHSLKTKKYTDARLRRAIIFSMCSVTDEMLKLPPAYTTLLAATKSGTQLLSSVKKKLGMMLVSTPAMLASLPECAKPQMLACRRAESLRAVCCERIFPTEKALKIPPVIL